MRLEIDNPTEVGFQTPNASATVGTEFVGGSNVNDLLKRAIASAQSGDRVQARTLLFQAAEANPSDVDVWLWLASISEYPEELLGFLKNVLEISPDHPRALRWETSTRKLLAKTLVQRGVSASNDGQADYAAQCFDNAVEYDDQCEMAWLWKSSKADDEARRVQYLEKVLEINPSNPEARDALDVISSDRQSSKFAEAKAAAVAGEWADAEYLLDEVLELNLSHLDAWRLRSHISRTLDEQLLAYDRMLEIDPENSCAVSGREFLSAIVGSNHEQSVEVVEMKPAAEVDNSFNSIPESPFDTVAKSPAEEIPHGELDTAAVDSPALSSSFNDPEPFESPTEELVQPAAFEVAEPESAKPNFTFDLDAEREHHDLAVASSESDDDDLTDDHVMTQETPEPAATFASFDAPSNHSDVQDEVTASEVEASVFGTAAEFVEPQVEVQEIENVVVASNGHIDPQGNQCPYCNEELQSQIFACPSCRSILSLADIDALLGDTNVDRNAIESSIAGMESEWNERSFTEQELTILGIGHLNLKNYDLGVAYLQEASNLNLNNVILAGQLNTVAIRLDEIRRHSDDVESKKKGKTILVVDDSATVRKLISSKLEKSGHSVICAEDGIAAMEVLTSTVPDLVLLDITMPRMDGYTVCKNIRSDERCKDVPVVMISGKDGFFDKVRGTMAGTTAYITKPFGPETLMRALESYLLADEVSHQKITAELI